MSDMNALLQQLEAAADETVLSTFSSEGAARNITANELIRSAKLLATTFETMACKRIALYAQNGPEWVIADLASQFCNCLIIPIPLFFSASQITHVLNSSGVDTVITDQSLDQGELTSFVVDQESSLDIQRVLSKQFRIARCDAGFVSQGDAQSDLQSDLLRSPEIPDGTHKITFTSGTTGTPKGVCLSLNHQLAVAQSIASACEVPHPTHLCILPLSTLLENIGGVYAPMLSGGRVVVPALSELGLDSNVGINSEKLTGCIDRVRPNTLILVPELLDLLLVEVVLGWKPPDSLKFIAVGGGRVSKATLQHASDCELPVYEGYGLSECASVVALNVPGHEKTGTVGCALPHVAVEVVNGEIAVHGGAFLGYLDEPASWYSQSVFTGDLGSIDSQGHIRISGRKKNQLISSFGRNISPEWVESELQAGPVLKRAVVFGDARPYCVALVVPCDPDADPAIISTWIERVNSTLPEYAQIRNWHRLAGDLSSDPDLLTSNGRPKRLNIGTKYSIEIEALYLENTKEMCA